MKESTRPKIINKYLLFLIQLFIIIIHLKTFVLSQYYGVKRFKYYKIMTEQFLNGYSLSPEYYKFLEIKELDEYWTTRAEAIADSLDDKYTHIKP